MRKKIIVQQCLYYRGISIALFAFSFILSLVLVLLCAGFSSYTKAGLEGAKSSFGGYERQVSGASEYLEKTMRTLEKDGRAAAVTSSDGSIVLEEKGATTKITYISRDSRYGKLSKGTYPSRNNEASISEHIAKLIGADIGTTVLLSDTENGELHTLYITGITVNPGLVEENFVAAVKSDVADTAHMWLTDEPLYELDREFGAGVARQRSLEQAIQQTKENSVSRSLGAVRIFIPIVSFFYLLGIAFLIISQRRTYAITTNALNAAGYKPQDSWRTAILGHTILITSACLIGGISATLIFAGFSSRIGLLLGQRWDAPPLSLSLLVTLVLFIFSIAATRVCLLFLRNPHFLYFTGNAPQRPKLILFLGVLGTLATLILIGSRQTLLFIYGHDFAQFIGALAIPLLFLAIGYKKNKPITAQISSRAWLPRYVGIALSCYLCFGAALYSGYAMISVNGHISLSTKERSFFVAEFVTSESLHTLNKRFPELMKNAMVLTDANETEGTIRATTHLGIKCDAINFRSEECTTTDISMAHIAFSAQGSEHLIGHANPQVINPDGSTTVVRFALGDNSITELGDVEGVVADEALVFSHMPALVIKEGSATAKNLNILPSHLHTVAIENFADFPEDLRNDFRSFILVSNSFAEINETDTPEYRQLKMQALLRPFLAAIISLIIFSVLMASAYSDQKEVRRFADSLGARTRYKHALSSPLTLSFGASICLATIGGRLCAMDHLPFTQGSISFSDPGFYWTIPILGAFIMFLYPYTHRRKFEEK